jgi:hypothetical protein
MMASSEPQQLPSRLAPLREALAGKRHDQPPRYLFSEPFERTRGLLRQGLLAVLTPGNDRLAAFWSSA